MNLFLNKAIESFTELELEVYNFVLNNSEKIPYMTIRELSKEAHVSATTVVNFCKKLQCDGFSEFKVKYKMSLEDKKSKIILANSSLDNFIIRAATKEFNDKLDEISSVLNEPGNFISIGFGKSRIMAEYAADYFTSLGTLCHYINNPFMDFGQVDLDRGKAIIFSVLGENDIINTTVETLKQKKVSIISVTNTTNNTLAKRSHYNIAYHIQYENVVTNFSVDITTQIPVLYIIETLAKKTHNLSIETVQE